MTADIVVFPKVTLRATEEPARGVLTRAWAEQHAPLIEAALDLLQADDDEFRRRCQSIAENEGPTVLEQLTAQLDRLSAHVGGVVSALALTASRIRSTMSPTGGRA